MRLMLHVAIYNCLQLLRRGEWTRLAYLIRVKWHGLDFTKVEVDALDLNAERSRAHEESGPALAQVLRTLPISESDAALDIGCGKGSAILVMARYPFARVDGVDVSEELIKIARENLRRMRVRNSTLFHSNAVAFDGYDHYTFYYLYNPFPPAVMTETMGRISESLKRRPRKAILVYTNPKDCGPIERAGFRKVAEFEGKEGEFPPVFVYEAGPADAMPECGPQAAPGEACL
jgi:SAM-dependent methyltransferase